MPSLPRGCSCLFNQRSTSAAGMQGKITSSPGASGPRCVTGARFANAKSSVFLALGNRSARQPDLGEDRRVVAQRLVHVRDYLHDLAEQGALAVIHHFGDEVGADGLAVGVELDLAVGGIDLGLGEGFLELRLVVAEVA